MPTLTLAGKQSSEWASLNPVLADGEKGYERDTGRYKVGDGVKTWNELSYESASTTPVSSGVELAIDSRIEAHKDEDEPHPVYDDGPSLLLLYENAKV